MAQVENEITKAVISLFSMIRWVAWRQNNNATPIRQGARIVGLRKFEGMKGISDVIALQPMPVIPKEEMYQDEVRPVWWVEVKNPSLGKDGKQGKLSKDQKNFRDLVEAAGHVYVVAYSANDVLEELKKRGHWKE